MLGLQRDTSDRGRAPPHPDFTNEDHLNGFCSQKASQEDEQAQIPQAAQGEQTQAQEQVVFTSQASAETGAWLFPI
jgi:hypothetical protein